MHYPKSTITVKVVVGCLKGDIKEEIFTKRLSHIGTNYYSTFDRSYINDDIGYHRIKNGNNYSYSLHIYHPKNHKTIYFD